MFKGLELIVAEQLVWSYEISIKAAKGESIDEVGDWEKKIELLRKETSRKNEAVKEKSIETTRDIIINSIRLLVKTILEKIKPLEEFYQKAEITIFFNEKDASPNTKLDLLFNDIFVFTENINSIDFSQTLKKFKRNGINTFHSSYKTVVNFSDLTYFIIINNDPKKRTIKLNNEYLTNEEIDLIVLSITDDIYTGIQEMIKNPR